MTRQERPERRLSDQTASEATDEPIARSGALAEALERLETAVGQIQDSDTFRAYLDVQAKFYRYSPNNALLILAQRPDATQVAGYGAWKTLGRQVRRGERGIKILVPMRVRSRSADRQHDAADHQDAPKVPDPQIDTDPQSAAPGVRRLLFGVGTVFDIRQTDGDPLPTIEVPELTGDAGLALYGLLERVAQDEGLAIRRGSERLGPATMGFYSPTERLIVLREAGQLQMTKTLAHELAHHYAAHRTSNAASETVAESVAYVTLTHHGLDSGARSFPYVATWSRELAVLRTALGEIQAISSRLIDLTHTGVSRHVRMDTDYVEHRHGSRNDAVIRGSKGQSG
jgi:antirestriction protein ArdC